MQDTEGLMLPSLLPILRGRNQEGIASLFIIVVRKQILVSVLFRFLSFLTAPGHMTTAFRPSRTYILLKELDTNPTGYEIESSPVQ